MRGRVRGEEEVGRKRGGGREAEARRGEGECSTLVCINGVLLCFLDNEREREREGGSEGVR